MMSHYDLTLKIRYTLRGLYDWIRLLKSACVIRKPLSI